VIVNAVSVRKLSTWIRFDSVVDSKKTLLLDKLGINRSKPEDLGIPS
jgi:hypothetical protein